MFKAVLLGFIQGVTEFLPVSSSGHLAILHQLLDTPPILAFDVLAHLGTLIAIICFFRKDLLFLLRGSLGLAGPVTARRKRRLLMKLALASLPVVLVGLFLGSRISWLLANPKFLALGFWFTALLLLGSRFWRLPVGRGRFFLVGLFQALAIIPGISRSGATIASGRILGEGKKPAFKFSFFLGLISIGGAVIYELPQMVRFNSGQVKEALVIVLTAFLSGLLALKTLYQLFLNDRMWYLSFYCFFLGLAVFFLL